MLIKRSETFAQNNTNCVDLSFSDKNGPIFLFAGRWGCLAGCQTSKREGVHGDEMINLLLFHAINALLAVFQANKQIRGLHAASGCL
ncbi:TPA: hypothetical protein ACGSZS_003485 [Escherichia coli]